MLVALIFLSLLLALARPACAETPAEREAKKLHELFVDDGTLNMGEAVYSGRDQIRQWGLDAIKAHTYDGIRHVCGNMRFFSDSADSAEGVTVLTVFFDNRQDTLGTSVPWVVGEDHDQFMRTDHGWRIAQRNWETLFARPSPTA